MKYQVPAGPDYSELTAKIDAFLGSKIADNLVDGNKQQVDDFLAQIEADVTAEFGSEDDDDLNESVGVVFQKLKRNIFVTQLSKKFVLTVVKLTRFVTSISTLIYCLRCMDQGVYPWGNTKLRYYIGY